MIEIQIDRVIHDEFNLVVNQPNVFMTTGEVLG